MDDFYDKDMDELKFNEAQLQEIEMEFKYLQQFPLEGNDDIEDIEEF